uniref:Shikimate kinase n=1 Tax=Candidatus Kentrum sp. FM TaxID=2126340 RepID=A0A450WRM1_9GAMM|nr:MAG: shikimate kinase/3-dehydroquinate synthase [Candidatus Kentron sp. FM]VFJ72482.1 MAG: shikimate kinase/3-dehydroquinate synthase [Candidatus Kentron sp. FM]VFK19706.1 MAG: shikimate kinase/3-dehydroquinate synthase [Candidatus Kentron sp. FM]
MTNIFLIGPMGAGKTSVGRQLAKSLEKRFIDSDREIEADSGATISLLFELEGEAGFRQRERSMIDGLTQQQDIVLATGGGVVLNKENRANLSRRGTVIYLYASIAQLVQRTAGDKSRPLLQTADPHARLAEIMTERDPLYRQVADLIVDTGGKPSWYLARHIAQLLSR